MNTQLDEVVHRALGDVIDATPELGPTPTRIVRPEPGPSSGRRSWVLAAAVVTAIVGVGGLFIAGRSDENIEPASTTPASTAPPSDAIVVPGPEPLGYIPTVDQVNEAIMAYADCLGEHLTGTIRYNPSRPTGMIQDIGDPSASGPSDLIGAETLRCETATNVQGFLEAFSAFGAIEVDQSVATIDSFRQCVVARVPDIETELDAAGITSLDALEAGYLELIRRHPRETGTVISDCRDEAVYGTDIRIGS